MTIQQLRYFQRVAQEENISTAAASLYISQPALSRSIANLEQELDCKLTVKSGRNIKLSEYGIEFLKHVNLVLNQMDQCTKNLNAIRSASGKNVSIAAPGKLISPEFVDRIYNIDPQITISGINRQESGTTEKFLKGTIDFYVSDSYMSRPFADHNISSAFLMDEKLGVMVSRKHPLSTRDSIRTAELDGATFTVYPKEVHIRNTFDSICQTYGIHPARLLECSTILQALPFILSGKAITLFPFWSIQAFAQENPDLRALPIEDRYEITKLYLFWRNDRPLSESAIIVRDQLIAYYK